MSRHRNVRTLNYDEEYDEYFGGNYGQSVEDEYCISPGTEAQFMFRRDRDNANIANYLHEKDNSIDETTQDMATDHKDHKRSRADSFDQVHMPMDATERAKLLSCVEGMQNVVGDTIHESTLMQFAVKHNYNLEEALDAVLTSSSKPDNEPKPLEHQHERTMITDKGSDGDLDDLFDQINLKTNIRPDDTASEMTSDFYLNTQSILTKRGKSFIDQRLKSSGNYNRLFESQFKSSDNTVSSKSLNPSKILCSPKNQNQPEIITHKASTLYHDKDNDKILASDQHIQYLDNDSSKTDLKVLVQANSDNNTYKFRNSKKSSSIPNSFFRAITAKLAGRIRPIHQGKISVKKLMLDYYKATNHEIFPFTSPPQLTREPVRIAERTDRTDPSTLVQPIGRMTFGPNIKTQIGKDPSIKKIEPVKSNTKKMDADVLDLKNKLLRPSSPVSIEGSRQASSSADTRQATPIVKVPSTKNMSSEAILAQYKKDRSDGKALLNLVVIGHVDAGKSTLMGHLLYLLGCVSKKAMHRYETDSKKIGKTSFAYAWVLDETEEERSRGITMDIAQSRFETDTKNVTLLDAPGHKDFIPNMITGASQADVAILVVDATNGEFEAGFDYGGQTREHTMLIRSLGVSQLTVAVNKLDNVNWSYDRYNEILMKLSVFLKQTGFKDQDITYVPCSGLTGENLISRCQTAALSSWYKGPSLLEVIDAFKPPERLITKPFRLVVSDIFKGTGSGISISGRVEAGMVQNAQKMLLMPSGEPCVAKNVCVEYSSSTQAFAGDQVIMVITGCDANAVTTGCFLCDPSNPAPVTTKFEAKIVVFNHAEVPLTKGFPIELHYKSLCEQAVIKRIVSQLNKSSGEIIKKKPRCLTKNSSGVIQVEVSRPICIELYKDYKDLGRFMIRSGGTTIAAGLVNQIM